jgi:hypothetical protein
MAPQLDGADLKTLRLASPGLTSEQLAKSLRYLRLVLERGGGDPHLGARVRNDALAEVGLDSAELSRITPLLTDFCGRRWTARQLARRAEELTQKAGAGTLTPRETAVREKLPVEVARAQDLSGFEARHGREVLSLLSAHEDELLALHQQLRGAF